MEGWKGVLVCSGLEGLVEKRKRKRRGVGERERKRRRERNTHKVQHLPTQNQQMQPIHNLLDTRMQIPIMQIKDVDVVCFDVFEGRVEGETHVFDVVAEEVFLVGYGGVASVGCVCVLWRQGRSGMGVGWV